MVEWITKINGVVNGIVWGPIGLALLFCTGLWMTLRTGGFQFRRVGHWMRHTIGAVFTNKEVTAHTSKEDMAISQFQSMCTALAGTIGTGNIVGVVTALIVLGGLKRVAAVTEKLVPIMALFYIVGAVVIVVLHAGNIPAAFRAIFRGAFNLQAAGGGTLGYGISQSLTWGFKRGAFSNEAGLGSAVMVNSSANVKEPVQQGMWGVFEIFADTIVVCTLTALVILTTGVVDIESGSVLAGVQDNALVGQAFTAAFGSFGPKFIAISLLFFAYSTVLGWSHYGTKAVEYLFGQKGTRVYKVIFVGMVVVGATMKLGLAWDLSDTFNGLMMIPNLLAVLALSGTVVQITKNYLDRKVNGKDIPPMWSVFAEYQKAEEAEAAEEAKQAREAEALAELEILGGHAVNE